MKKVEDNQKLSIVGIEIPDGISAQGTKVKLSNGQYLRGVQSITLHCDTDHPVWSLSLKVLPEFVDQEVFKALLENVAAGDLTVEQANASSELVKLSLMNQGWHRDDKGCMWPPVSGPATAGPSKIPTEGTHILPKDEKILSSHLVQNADKWCKVVGGNSE